MRCIRLSLSVSAVVFMVGCGDGSPDSSTATAAGTNAATASEPSARPAATSAPAETTAAATTALTGVPQSSDAISPPPDSEVQAVPAQPLPVQTTENTSNGADLQASKEQDYRAVMVSVGGSTPIGIDPYAQGGSGATVSVGGSTPIGIDPYARGGNGAIVQVGGDAANMAWCRPTSNPSFLVAQYFVNVPNGRVAHRTGVQDYATGQQGFDAWQVTDVVGGAFSAVRYMNAPPAGRLWAPIVQVYRQVNNQWQFYHAYYLKVNYNYDWCS